MARTTERDMKEIAHACVKTAKAKGAGEAAARAYKVRDVAVQWRDGKLEQITESTTRGVGIQLYVDGRYSSVSTSDLRPEAIERFLEESVALARTLAKDPFRALPDAAFYQGRREADLGVYDAGYARATMDGRRDLARRMEEAAHTVPGADAIVSVSSGAADSLTTVARVASNGFSGEREETFFGAWLDVSAKDADGRRPEDWAETSGRVLAKLGNPDDVAREAALRALGARGSKKTESAVTRVVVENRAAGRLFSALAAPLGGRALQQKQSFLEGQLGKTIGSKLLTVTDDPLMTAGYMSRAWDDEGMTAKKRPIVENGVLKSYYIDSYYARKLKTAPTTASSTNLVFAPGTRDLAGLVQDANDGILVTSFLGGNSNNTTGEYSFGIQGYRIRGGKRAEPVCEMNVSGNQRELWKKLVALGNDPYPYSAMRTPSLAFEGLQVAGT